MKSKISHITKLSLAEIHIKMKGGEKKMELDQDKEFEEWQREFTYQAEMQKRHSDYLKKGWIYKISELEKLTGVKPSFSKEQIQEGYIACLQNKDFPRFEALKYMTSVEPELSEDWIQKAYGAAIKYREWDKLKSMIEKYNLQPKKLMLEKYIDGEDWRSANYEGFFEMAELIGTSEDIIQCLYRASGGLDYWDVGHLCDLLGEDFDDILEICGEKEEREEAYRKYDF